MEKFIEYALPSVIALMFVTVIYFFLKLYMNFNFNPRKETKNMISFNAGFIFLGLVGLMLILVGIKG